jgi:hypothetical protein
MKWITKMRAWTKPALLKYPLWLFSQNKADNKADPCYPKYNQFNPGVGSSRYQVHKKTDRQKYRPDGSILPTSFGGKELPDAQKTGNAKDDNGDVGNGSHNLTPPWLKNAG